MRLVVALLGTRKDRGGINHGNWVVEELSTKERVVGRVAYRDPVSEGVGSVLESQGTQDHTA